MNVQSTLYRFVSTRKLDITNTKTAHPSLFLILSIGECNVAQLKEPLAVLDTGHGRCVAASLPQPATTQDQVMDVTSILGSCLHFN